MVDKQTDEYLLKYSEQVDITSADEIKQNLELEVAPDIVVSALKGKVIDGEYTPVARATVKLFDEDFNPVVHTVTDELGLYLFDNVTPGTYLIYAVKDGYNLSTKQTVTITETVTIFNDIMISKTIDDKAMYYGVVKDKDGAVIDSMIINLLQNDVVMYTTLSADDGEFIIYGIEEGEYQVEAYNDLYHYLGRHTIGFNPGVAHTSDIEATRYAEVLRGTINGTITDKVTKLPIRGAFVGGYKIENGKEKLLFGTLTDEDGRYFFGDVPEGQYIVKAKRVKTTL